MRVCGGEGSASVGVAGRRSARVALTSHGRLVVAAPGRLASPLKDAGALGLTLLAPRVPVLPLSPF